MEPWNSKEELLVDLPKSLIELKSLLTENLKEDFSNFSRLLQLEKTILKQFKHVKRLVKAVELKHIKRLVKAMEV